MKFPFTPILDIAPYPDCRAMTQEMGGLQMKWRIIEKKLTFMNQILHLNPQSLAMQIQQIQERENLLGLTQEVKDYVENLKLPDLFIESIPQSKWKTMVKSAIRKSNEEEVKAALLSYKKLKNRKNCLK